MKFPNAHILDVDLTTGKIMKNTLDGDVYKLYPGGSALGTYLMLKEAIPGIDPLGPDNLLIFSVSPLTGLPISGQSRISVTTKSPLTGCIADSQAGGFLPAHVKANGYDAVVFRGKSDKPVYLYIDGKNVELRDASKIWGNVTGEAEKLIRNDLDEERVEIAQIGPGGENLVKFASIMNMSNRANGRNGVGAVMGSKNLKALVVKKARPVKAYDMDGFKTLTKDVKKRIEENEVITDIAENGTAGALEYLNEEGFLATRNWQSGFFPEGSNNITGTTMTKTILKERDTCFGCAIRCKRVVEIEGKVDPLYGGPEYETCGTFGSFCGITSLESISIANQLCNMYGIDTISCGATISFAMECFEKGLLTKDNTDNLEITFGNAKIIPTLIKKIALRDGIGDLLAEGSKRAAEIIGGEAAKFSISVKGLELPAHMPHMKPGLGLIYAVCPIGADHQSSEHDPELCLPDDTEDRIRLAKLGLDKGYDNYYSLDAYKVKFAFTTQKFYSMLDTLSLCQFAFGPSYQLYGPDELVQFCKFGIGWETSIEELLEIGERRINLMRAFNEREGFDKGNDTLPKRMFEPLPDGPSKGVCVNEEDFESAKLKYYEYAGWDENTGNPTQDTLKKLSLDWLT